jgi:hypothetical protein
MSVLITQESVLFAALSVLRGGYQQKIKVTTIKGVTSCKMKKELLQFMILQVLATEQIEVTTEECECIKTDFNYISQDCVPPPPPPPAKTITLNSAAASCAAPNIPSISVDFDYENLSFPQNLSLQYNDGSSWIDLTQIAITQASGNVSQSFNISPSWNEGQFYSFRVYSSLDDVASNSETITSDYCTPTIKLVTASASCAFGAIQIEAESYWWQLPNDVITIEYFDGAFWQGLVNMGAGISGIGGTSPSIPIGTGTTIPAGTYPVRFRALTAGTVSQSINVSMGGC